MRDGGYSHVLGLFSPAFWLATMLVTRYQAWLNIKPVFLLKLPVFCRTSAASFTRQPMQTGSVNWGTPRLKCDGTRAETRFHLSAKRTSPFKLAGASVHSTAGSQGVRISGSNAGYTMFRGSVKGTGYPLHLPVSPSLPLPYITVRHHVSTGLYH